MRRELLHRVRELEQAIQVDNWLTLTFADGEQRRVQGHARHFFRLTAFVTDPDKFRSERAAGIVTVVENDLDSLRRAVNIAGPSAQLFWLVRAIALGPVDDNAAATNEWD